MNTAVLLGRPGVGPRSSIAHRIVSQDGNFVWLPGGGIIDGTKARDLGNTDDTRALRAGLLLGKDATTGKYANSFLGLTQGAYTSGGTSITVTVAQAAEIVRRVGPTGTLNFIGPPAAAGVVALIARAYSAVNLTNGVITVADLGANLIAGAIVAANDGTQVPRTVIPDGWGLQLAQPTDGDTDFPQIPIAGILKTDMLIDYPADASLKAWVRASMSAPGTGGFAFTDQF